MLPISISEVKWIEQTVYIGAMIGTIFLTLLGDVFGKKYILVGLIVPEAVSFDSNSVLTFKI